MIRGSSLILVVGFWLGIISYVFGQQKYPRLIRITSFAALQKNAREKKVEWTNPDGHHEEMTMIEMAIPFDYAMRERTSDFVHAVYGIDSIWLNPKMIVFHAMGDGDLKISLEVSSFLNDEIPDGWGNLSKAGKLPNGAHFIIDSDGTIICLSPPLSKSNEQVSYASENHHWLIKRHQDGNPVAIGIENVTPQGDYTGLTTAQIESNAKLTRWLIWFENGNLQFVAGHHQFNGDEDYQRFLTAFQLKNLKKQFRTRGRKDIGKKNMTEILKQVERFRIPVKNFFQ